MRRPKGRRSSKCEPYLHQEYNVKPCLPKSQFSRENALGCLLNALIDALNENQHLSRIIVMVPDDAFLAMINQTSPGVSLMIGKCLHWLINQVDRAIETKKDALKFRKPGTLTDFEPKVI